MSPDGSNQNQFAAAAFLEDEVKLDAAESKLVREVWNSVLRRTKHFHPAFHTHTGEQRLDDVDWSSIHSFKPHPPMRVRELLTRYYYDTRNLALHDQSVEVRIAPKGRAFKTSDKNW